VNAHQLTLLKNLKIDSKQTPILVETGSHKGNSAVIFSSFFKYVYSIEISQRLYEHCKKRAENEKIPNLKFLRGKSHELLKQIVKEIKDPYVLFLDAHGSGSNSSYYTSYDKLIGINGSPVQLEINAVKYNLPKIILIDDLSDFYNRGSGLVNEEDSFQGHYPHPDILINKLENLGYRCEVYNDNHYKKGILYAVK